MGARLCIYCRTPLHAKTRKAHVWPAALGGRLYSTDTNCDDCNNALGRVEDEVRATLQHTYAAVGAQNDEREPITARLNVDGHEFDLAGGAAFYRPPGARFNRDAKAIELPLPAGLANMASVTAAAMLRQGLGPDAVDRLTYAAGVQPTFPPAAGHDHRLRFGGEPSHKRFMAKVALELLAHFRYELTCRGELSEIRRFVRRGSGSLHSNPDLRSEGSGLISPDLRVLYNAVEVWSFRRSLFFRIVFLRHIRFTGALTTDWQGDPVRAAYAFDGRAPVPAIVKAVANEDGPNLSIFYSLMSVDVAAEAEREFEAANRQLARDLDIPLRQPVPPIDEYRAAVRAELMRRLARAAAKKERRRGSSS